MKMFIEPNDQCESRSVRALFQSARVLVTNFNADKKMLPVSIAKDNVKCLDYNMDDITFISAPRPRAKMAEINPYNKTWLDVMEMV